MHELLSEMSTNLVELDWHIRCSSPAGVSPSKLLKRFCRRISLEDWFLTCFCRLALMSIMLSLESWPDGIVTSSVVRFAGLLRRLVRGYTSNLLLTF